MLKFNIFCLILLINVSFIFSQGPQRLCCKDEVGGAGNDQYWFLQTPADTTIECHRNILGYNDYALPDIHGWAWEINGCHFSDDSFCNSVTGDGDDWCDQDDGQAPLNDNDDDGNGTNDIVSFTDDITSPGCGNTQQVVRTWEATSGCNGGTVTGDQTISIVDDFPPRLGVIDDFFIECSPFGFDAAMVGSASAFDMCAAVDLEVSTTLQSQTACQQVFEVEFTATDPGSGTGVCQTTIESYTVTLIDTIPPVPITGGDVLVSDCTNIPTTDSTRPIVSDSCSFSPAAPSATFLSTRVIPGDCEGNFIERRAYLLEDACGNQQTTFVDVYVNDNTPPTITPTLPENYVYFIDCQENLVFPVFTANDDCSSEDLQLTESIEYAETHENVLSTTITDTLVAIDGCGNIETRIYTVVVEENAFTSPFLFGPPTATKGVNFNVNVGYTSSTCTPADITLVVDTGAAILIAASNACFQQAGNGLIYCDSDAAGLSETLTLQVPADYLPSLIRISSSAEVHGGIIAPIPATLNIRLV